MLRVVRMLRRAGVEMLGLSPAGAF
jgi:hypothetical protein